MLNVLQINAGRRCFTISASRMAGLQGFQGQSLSPEIKQKRIEKKLKEIRREEKLQLETKPITDTFIPLSWKQSSKKRESFSSTPEEEERRILLQKEWTSYCANIKKVERTKLDLLKRSQHKALDELKLISEELYLRAVEADYTILPHSCFGPTLTPPLKEYLAPLGSIKQYYKVL